MKPKIYFVSGVCGAGKTTVIPHLKKLLPASQYDIRDFDEFGVPPKGGNEWRMAQTKKWLDIAAESAKQGKSTIICGFARPMDFDQLRTGEIPEIVVLLLDADAETIRARLRGRYTKDGVFDEAQTVIGIPVNDFIQSNVHYVNTMRNECMNARCPIVDTTWLTPEQVAEKVAAICWGAE